MLARATLVAALLVPTGCAHHHVAPLEPPPVVPISERIGDGSEPPPSEGWLRAREELDDLVERCADKRDALASDVHRADRNERLAFAGALGLSVAGSVASSRRGTTVVGPGPASYYPGYAYGAPAPATGGVPTVANLGPPAPGGRGPTLGLGAPNPLGLHADVVALDANQQLRLIDEELDAAYEKLDSLRTAPALTDADQEALDFHEERLRVLCAP